MVVVVLGGCRRNLHSARQQKQAQKARNSTYIGFDSERFLVKIYTLQRGLGYL